MRRYLHVREVMQILIYKMRTLTKRFDTVSPHNRTNLLSTLNQTSFKSVNKSSKSYQTSPYNSESKFMLANKHK